MNQAVMHAAHQSLPMLRSERDRAGDMNAEVTQTRGLFQFFRRNRNFNAALGQ